MDIIKLWLHEASRVYGDKLIEEKDMETFKKIKFEAAKVGFEVSMMVQKELSILYVSMAIYIKSRAIYLQLVPPLMRVNGSTEVVFWMH